MTWDPLSLMAVYLCVVWKLVICVYSRHGWKWLHFFLSFNGEISLYRNQDAHSERVITIKVPKPPLQLGPPPRLAYPLVVFLICETEEDEPCHPDDTVRKRRSLFLFLFAIRTKPSRKRAINRRVVFSQSQVSSGQIMLMILMITGVVCTFSEWIRAFESKDFRPKQTRHHFI